MKKALITLALMFVAFTGNAQSNLDGDMNHDGEKNITDVMLLVDEILNGSKPQSYLTCPDDHHPHIIDLGLPSGTKWACCNVGATTPEAYGGYYAWGETEEKSVYNDVTYLYATGEDVDGNGWYDDYLSDTDTDGVWKNLGDDIAGTQYDVAHVKWGGSWVMPSREQQDELRNNCTYEWTTVNGVEGGKFTSKTNGGIIFLPAAGTRGGSGLYFAGSNGYYWSSTQYPSYTKFAYGLRFNSGSTDWSNYDRDYGRSVRPVVRN